jgi:hypothetical protein
VEPIPAGLLCVAVDSIACFGPVLFGCLSVVSFQLLQTCNIGVLLSVAMASPNLDIISWNVRGLNTPARCITVHDMLSSTFCHLACLQEKKLHSVDGTLAAYLGGYKLNNFIFKPAVGTKGGILLLWSDNHLDLTDMY